MGRGRVIADSGQSRTTWWRGISMGVAIKSGPGVVQEQALEDKSRWACRDWGRSGDDFRQRE